MKKQEAQVKLNDLTIIGNQWDESSVQVIQTVAEALKNITELLKKSDVKISLDKSLEVSGSVKID